MKTFSKHFPIKWKNKKLSETLSKCIIRAVSKKFPDWLQTHPSCNEHRTYILEILVRTLIFKKCKDVSPEIKSSSSSFKPPEKLNILQNR